MIPYERVKMESNSVKMTIFRFLYMNSGLKWHTYGHFLFDSSGGQVGIDFL